jgi:opacity protein-like surface antigen
MRRLLLTLTLLVSPLAAAQASDAAKTAEDLTCSNVIKAGDTLDTIKARFAGETAIEDVSGAEGETAKALTIFGKDPARKLTVAFYDDEMTKIAAVGPAPGATHWTIAGLRIGSSLEEVIAANGGTFDVSGFEWDYGGYVTDLKGGKLSNLDGGCIVTVRFDPPQGKPVPNALSGERSIPSSDTKLAKLKPVVSDLQIGWPDKDAGSGSAD